MTNEVSNHVKEMAQKRVGDLYNTANDPKNWNPQFPVCYEVTDGKQITEYKVVDGQIDWTTAHSLPRSQNMGYCATVEKIFSQTKVLNKIGRDKNGHREWKIPRQV